MKNLLFVTRYSIAFAFMNATVSIITGCNDSPQTLALSGDIIGSSVLYDIDGNQIANDTGITVSVEGENHTTTTNSLGQWDLVGLTTGTYNIDISKPGYGTRKILDFQFVGGGQADAGNVGLYQIPTYSVTKLSDTTINGNVILNGTLSSPLPTNLMVAYITVFFDTTSSVSLDPKNYLTWSNINTIDTMFSEGVASLEKFGFNSGQTAYAIAYTSNISPMGYTDFATGNQVFTGLNPTASYVVSFKVP